LKHEDDAKHAHGVLWEVLDWAKHFAIAGIIGVLFITFVGQRSVVHGMSMSPTLHDNDQLFIEKITPRLGAIKRGDIVTIKVDGVKGVEGLKEGHDRLIKRVIALEGDRLAIRDGKVYLNGELLEEDYIGDIDYTFSGHVTDEITVGEG